MFETLDCWNSVSNRYLNSWLLGSQILLMSLWYWWGNQSLSLIRVVLSLVFCFGWDLFVFNLFTNQKKYIYNMKVTKFASWKGKSQDIPDLCDEIEISGFFPLPKSRDPRIQQNPVPEIPKLKILDPDWPFSGTISILQFFSKYIFHSSWKKLFSFGVYATI